MKKFLIVIFMFLIMPCFAVENVSSFSTSDWGPYMKNIEERIKNNWTPPQSSKSIKAVAKFTIAKDGRLLDCKITQSSGNKEYDKAAINAIRFSHPFKKLPKEFKGDSVPIEFDFDYNVKNGINFSPIQNWWKSYLENLESKIKSNWNHPASNYPFKIIAMLTIDKEGELLDVKITQSSGNKEYDKAAIKAVKISAPFDKLPKEFLGDKVPIVFTFDYQLKQNVNSNPMYNGSVKSNTNSH